MPDLDLTPPVTDADREVHTYRVLSRRNEEDWRHNHEREHDALKSQGVMDKETLGRALADSLTAHREEHARQREADSLADRKLDTRLDSMNEIRAALRDAQANGVTRDQVDDKIGAAMARLDTFQANIAAQFTRVDALMLDLQKSRAEAQGRNTVLAGGIGAIAFVFSVSASVILHFLK